MALVLRSSALVIPVPVHADCPRGLSTRTVQWPDANAARRHRDLAGRMRCVDTANRDGGPGRSTGIPPRCLLPRREETAMTESTTAGPRPTSPGATTENNTIRPFHVELPEEHLVELRRRIAATRWTSRELVTDRSQGVQLATMQALAGYWATEYDWRRCEARLNALPNFITEIDGLDIHFIHVRSEHEEALPLLVCHGWPGSVIEQLKLIDPLTNPTAHGASAADAFHLVIPSLPGHGFSAKPTSTGWD